MSNRKFRMNAGWHVFDSAHMNGVRHAVTGLLAVCCGMLIWALFPQQHTQPDNTAPRNDMTMPDHLDAQMQAERVVASHLFGKSAPNNDDEAASQADTPIDIQGLLYSEDMTAALAILDVGGSSGAYKVGDKLPDGEILAAIGTRAVKLSDGDGSRIITLGTSTGSGIDVAGLPAGAVSPVGLGAKLPSILQPVQLPVGATPLMKLRALRQQLIKH